MFKCNLASYNIRLHAISNAADDQDQFSDRHIYVDLNNYQEEFEFMYESFRDDRRWSRLEEVWTEKDLEFSKSKVQFY